MQVCTRFLQEGLNISDSYTSRTHVQSTGVPGPPAVPFYPFGAEGSPIATLK